MDADTHEAAFREAPEAILLFDDDGLIVDCNAAAEQLFAVPAQELTGKNLSVFGPSVAYDYRPGIRGLVAAGWNQGELQMTRGNGEMFAAEYRSRANVIRGVHATIVRDVSAQKRAHDSLRASEELFFRSLIAAPAAIAVTSLATDACLLANEEFLKMTGYWRSEVIGSNLARGKLWCDDELRGALSARLTAGESIDTVLTRFCGKQGQTFLVHAGLTTTEIGSERCEVLVALHADVLGRPGSYQ